MTALGGAARLPRVGSGSTNLRSPVPGTTRPSGSRAGRGLYAKFGTGPKQRGTAAGSRLAAGAGSSAVRAAGTAAATRPFARPPLSRMVRSNQVERSLRNIAMTLPGVGARGSPPRRGDPVGPALC
ncbi:hypothetical protein GCM10027614_67480 [Micromonospora vulcania]